MPRRATRFDGAGKVNGAAIQQQLLRQRGFASVGMRDDCKGASLGDLASATVGVASTVVGTTVVVGSAAVSTASAAKTVTFAAVGTAVAVGSLGVAGAQAVANASRDNDVAMTSVVATAPDRFSATDGRKWITRNCPDVAVGQPALWVATRSGENEIRINTGTRCPVLLLE